MFRIVLIIVITTAFLVQTFGAAKADKKTKKCDKIQKNFTKKCKNPCDENLSKKCRKLKKKLESKCKIVIDCSPPPPPPKKLAWPGDFRWSFAGDVAGYNCLKVEEPAEPASYTWGDNRFCWKTGMNDPGLRWSYAGPIAGMRCTRIFEPADPHTWADNYLCVPKNSDLVLSWSYAGPIPGEQGCIQWKEDADPHTWNDNYLCGHQAGFESHKPPAQWPQDFAWSFAGPLAGYTCLAIAEPAEPKSTTWGDNFFCVKSDKASPFMQWSFAGPIYDRKCTRILEPADPHTWTDNYLCVPNDSPLNFHWTFSTGGRKGQCIQWKEPADAAGTWLDNYLCM